ncbi:MAG: coenzyme PQQ precursor peptide PqqA [Gammaproteobacteria bacterium RIFCSPLOWO2_02_FULL_61_13]|nr:MAG: coenzyme PQQ precursor peptide PqqA [Gammaproteobacteria bacterium RIFCSPLOWO2_02_FULL_61_13]
MHQRRFKMKWETPEYNNIRFGFEVTMYINNK